MPLHSALIELAKILTASILSIKQNIHITSIVKVFNKFLKLFSLKERSSGKDYNLFYITVSMSKTRIVDACD